jgi:hypothetical protein
MGLSGDRQKAVDDAVRAITSTFRSEDDLVAHLTKFCVDLRDYIRFLAGVSTIIFDCSPFQPLNAAELLAESARRARFERDPSVLHRGTGKQTIKNGRELCFCGPFFAVTHEDAAFEKALNDAEAAVTRSFYDRLAIAKFLDSLGSDIGPICAHLRTIAGYMDEDGTGVPSETCRYRRHRFVINASGM